jgi:hypothetical protein
MSAFRGPVPSIGAATEPSSRSLPSFRACYGPLAQPETQRRNGVASAGLVLSLPGPGIPVAGRVCPARDIRYDFASPTLSKAPQLAKPNYAFAKRQRDLAKQQKKEEKRKRKLEPTDPQLVTGDPQASASDQPPSTNEKLVP